VARAKRTERTDARKRHRAEQAVAAEASASEGTVASSGSSSKAAAQPAKGAQRPGFMTMMKSAYRSPNIIEDLKSLPVVVTNIGFLAALGGSAAI
jgi:hypothetical protein